MFVRVDIYQISRVFAAIFTLKPKVIKPGPRHVEQLHFSSNSKASRTKRKYHRNPKPVTQIRVPLRTIHITWVIPRSTIVDRMVWRDTDMPRPGSRRQTSDSRSSIKRSTGLISMKLLTSIIIANLGITWALPTQQESEQESALFACADLLYNTAFCCSKGSLGLYVNCEAREAASTAIDLPRTGIT
ncbi:hypothetical protein CHU98_g10325 [Xylaria longipes]|nr:hypothetical protein CHU98_g10325 [Xylaria longipes]